jgi:predicted phosphoadenosine phosphosulfate sulfurtransferase
MAKVRKQRRVEKSCYDLAVERVEKCFDRFDKVVVSFSGGKDSTACLQIALDAATRRNTLPLEVVSFDEEAIPPDTVEYMDRVSQRGDVSFRWYCIPIEHRNACSEKQPVWYTWGEEDRDKWVRDLPSQAITNLPGFKRGMAIPDAIPLIYGPNMGNVCVIMGIRCQESMSRYRAVASKPASVTDDAFLGAFEGARWITKAYPIYDWSTDDVWRAPGLMGWDYNRAYDVMEKIGMPRNLQRCAPPFGEQPIRGLHTFKTCWPELWSKMVGRVAGAATAARYANTGLYACGLSDEDLPHGKTWQQHTLDLVSRLEESAKPEVADAISSLMGMHRSRTNDAMPDDQPHPLSGYCWKFICVVAKVGSNKFGRQAQKVNNKAIAARRKNGILS